MKKRRLAIIILLILVVGNEIYRFMEVRRLKQNDCVYSQFKRQGERGSIDPKSSLNEFSHLYICNDGKETFSPYDIRKRVRPWE